MAKETRKEYLERRVQEAKNLGRTVDVTIPNNPTKAQLTALDDKINKVLYPSGVYGTTGAAVTPQVSNEEAARRAAQQIEDARLENQKVNWIEQMTQTFKNYGLSSLAPKITEYIQSGYSPDTVSLKLQESPEYLQRFSGNETRKKMGLPVLTPAEYLSAESSYKQIMRANGLPEGFYDSQESLAKFISNDVSPSEFQSRVNAASLSLNNADPFYTQSLQEMYGLTQGEMLAHVLDPQKALPFINKQVQAAQFGAEARRQGLSLGAPVAEQYANMGVTQKEAQQGFQQIAQLMPTAETLSGIYKNQAGPYGQEQAIAEAFGGEGAAEASLRRKKLSALETANFSGSSGTGKSSFAQQQTGQI